MTLKLQEDKNTTQITTKLKKLFCFLTFGNDAVNKAHGEAKEDEVV